MKSKTVLLGIIALGVSAFGGYQYQGYADQFRSEEPGTFASCQRLEKITPFTSGDATTDELIVRAIKNTPHGAIELSDISAGGEITLDPPIMTGAKELPEGPESHLQISPTGRITVATSSESADLYGQATIERPEGSTENGLYLVEMDYLDAQGNKLESGYTAATLMTPTDLSNTIPVLVPSDEKEREKLSQIKTTKLTQVCEGKEKQ